ncbi:MAG TPA: hypothetical protein DC049_11830, partial [Spirochaetia bacterium]|nr:hypothetical protein [Spirochaetia bacterium]
MNFKCLICRNTHASLFLDCTAFRYMRCRECGLVMQDPYPRSEAVAGIYREDYYKYELVNEENFFNLMILGLKDIGFSSLFAQPGKILDIGCATGRLLRYFQEQGWEASGIELCKPSAEHARTRYGLAVECADIDIYTPKPAHFNFIHSSHVIEHVKNPAGFLEKIYTALLPGGYAAVTTPCLDSLQFRLYKKKWRSAIPQHLQLFSKNVFKRAANMSKLIIEKQVSWGGIPAEAAISPVMK